MKKRLTLLAVALPALAGCETLGPSLTNKGALQAFKPITYSDYCSAQRGIADHNSRYWSIEKGKPVTYRAPCDIDKKKPAPSTEPKTS